MSVEPTAGELLMPQEVAKLFRVNPKTVSRWARAGLIQAVRTPGGHRRYRLVDVQALQEKAAGR